MIWQIRDGDGDTEYPSRHVPVVDEPAAILLKTAFCAVDAAQNSAAYGPGTHAWDASPHPAPRQHVWPAGGPASRRAHARKHGLMAVVHARFRPHELSGDWPLVGA